MPGPRGVIATTHWLATEAGAAVFERGGNAVDAAVAAGFVLQVVEPDMNGPGGEVVALVRHPAEPGVRVVCGQGPAPAAATARHFAALGLDLVPGNGMLAATVPGAFGAWTLMLQRWGTIELGDALDAAIGYAVRGFPVIERTVATIRTLARTFETYWPTSARVWLPDGAPPASGTPVTNPVLAKVWTRVMTEAHARAGTREGRLAAANDVWYRGFVAEEIEQFCVNTEVRDVSGRNHSGLLTGDDLDAWEPSLEDPVQYDFGGFTIVKSGPWGQGPVLCQQLALLEDVEPSGPDRVHTAIECAKLAFADREAWYGDPHFTDVPLPDLLDPAYTARRRGLIAGRASHELRPGSPGGRVPRLPTTSGADVATTWGSALPNIGPGDTCHVAAADADGTIVSATPSGGWLQGAPVIAELGFALGTRAQMFWLEPGLPSSLTPGARPRTTLSPTMVLRRGEPWLALGTPGGDKQDQWSLWALLAAIDGRHTLAEAVNAPRGHVAHFPSSFYPRTALPGRFVAEADLSTDLIEGLRRRGHEVEVVAPQSLGRVCAAARDGRRLTVAADRRGGCASGASR